MSSSYAGDDILVAAGREGTLRAFNDLMLPYQHQVYDLACRITGGPAAAAEATSKAFASAFQTAERVDGRAIESHLVRLAKD